MSRLGILATTVAVFSLVPAVVAHGNGYELVVCGAGGSNKTFVPHADTSMSAGPTPNDCGEGIFARVDPGGANATVPAGSGASMTYTTPSGTSISTIQSMTGRFDTRGSKWSALLRTESSIIAGCRQGQDSCTGPLVGAVNISLPTDTHSLSLVAYCAAGGGACNAAKNSDATADNTNARAKVQFMQLYISDPTPPTITNNGGTAWTTDWIGGKRNVTFDASDGSGITAVQAFVDGALSGQQTHACGDYVAACRQWPGAGFDLDLSHLADGQHAVSVAATDRGTNVTRSDMTINVDNTPPTAPTGVATDTGKPWSASPTMHLGWSNPAQQFAPIAAAIIEACPAGQTSGCTTHEVAGADISKADFDLPGQGNYDVRVSLRDAAGNTAATQTSDPIRVGVDTEAPRDVAFRPLDPSNPSVVHVNANDGLSGVASGSVEIRRKHGHNWRSMPTQVDGQGLTAQIPDGRLSRGTYFLRAHVVDNAGNERTSTQRVDGKREVVHLPVRIAAHLQVGVSRGRGHKLVRSPHVSRGHRTRIAGRLTSPGGNPIGHVRVAVSSRVALPGKRFAPVGSVKTDGQGRFRFTAPAGRSRVIRFVYSGAPKIQPRVSVVHLGVRAASSIAASKHHVVNGDTVTFTGKVLTTPIPAKGKLVELQFYDRGEWRTFRSIHTDTKGRWQFEYRFTGTRGRTPYRFRALVPREAGYAYVGGASHSVRVIVQGL